MPSTSATLAIAAAVAALTITGCRASSSEGSPGAVSAPVIESSDALLSGETLLAIHITLSGDAIASLGRRPRDYVRAEVRLGDRRYAAAGLRLKGHRSMRGFDGKPSFKIHLGKFREDKDGKQEKKSTKKDDRAAGAEAATTTTDDGAPHAAAPRDKTSKKRFLGLERLTLNSMVEDPSMLHEVLGYRLYRAMGVPAPRAGYALVYVNEELFGVYANIETIDENFLRRNFTDASGPLYEGEYGCDAYEDDVPGFKLEEGDDAVGRAALARLAADPLALSDREQVLAYLAVSAFIGDFDGYRHSHNYRLYFEPTKGKWSFIPWGIDRTFKKALDIHDSDGLIARRCFADASCRADYARVLQKAASTFESLNLGAAMDTIGAVIDPALRVDPRRQHSLYDTRETRAEMRAFLASRPKGVRAQTSCIVDGQEVDTDGDGFGCLDCSPGDPAIHPGAVETCDRLDNDCDGLVDDDPGCACAAVTVEGAAFELCNLQMSWAEAAAYCEARGATIARLDSRSMGLHLYEAAQAIASEKWWIGFSDRAREGEFRWRDGAATNYTGWSRGEPDNDACNQDCAALEDDGFGLWHDTHCGARLPFICRGGAALPQGARR